MIEDIRNKIGQEEFDYQTLLVCLKDYARPRDKISSLIKKGFIIRVKKGLYIFGEAYRRRPYSLEILSNLIYGPSYISLEFALAYYGMIPERVEAMTSVTTGRSRSFSTPVGLFTYRYIPLKAFPVGMNRIEMGKDLAFLMATPEKALADKLNAEQNAGIHCRKDLCRHLEDDLRIDISILKTLDTESLNEMARSYGSRKIRLLSELVRDENHHNRKDFAHA